VCVCVCVCVCVYAIRKLFYYFIIFNENWIIY